MKPNDFNSGKLNSDTEYIEARLNDGETITLMFSQNNKTHTHTQTQSMYFTKICGTLYEFVYHSCAGAMLEYVLIPGKITSNIKKKKLDQFIINLFYL